MTAIDMELISMQMHVAAAGTSHMLVNAASPRFNVFHRVCCLILQRPPRRCTWRPRAPAACWSTRLSLGAMSPQGFTA